MWGRLEKFFFSLKAGTLFRYFSVFILYSVTIGFLLKLLKYEKVNFFLFFFRCSQLLFVRRAIHCS